MDSPSTNEQLELPLFEHTPEEMVKEFMTAFDANTDPDFAVKLIREEASETKEALAHLLKEITDLSYVMLYAFNAGVEEGKHITVDDDSLLGSLMYAYGIFPQATLDEAFKRVHRSNMSKLGDDGKPLRREDGKILKGPNYREPYLLDLV